MSRRLSTWCGALVALVAALGCGAAPRRARPARLPASPKAQSEAQPSPASFARLFSGTEGTCRVQASGRVDCWGQLPEGLAALIVRERPRQLAFFSAYRHEPACVLSEGGTATCLTGCVEDEPCRPTIETVAGVHNLLKVDSAIALVRDDGTLCMVRETKPLCGSASLFKGTYDKVPIAPVQLTMARPGPHDLRLPNGVSCEVSLRDGGTDFRCIKRSDEFPRAEAAGFALHDDGTIWARGGKVDQVEAQYPPDSALLEFSRIRELAANELLLCGMSATGEIACVERATRMGTFGASGVGRTSHPVPPLDCAEQLVSGGSHVCAQSCDNQTYCWGSNRFGQLAALPPAVTAHTLELDGVVRLAAGGEKTCAVLPDGGVKCWGSATFEQLGGPIFGVYLAKPVTIPLPATASAVVCGSDNACALLSDGRVSCWGSNLSFDLDDSEPDQLPPHVIEGVSHATQAGVNDRGGCALVNGDVYCWGSNRFGLRGLGNHEPAAARASQVPDVHGAIDLDVGGSVACAVLSRGGLRCWGSYAANSFASAKALDVAGVSDAVDVTCGDTGYCVRTRAGAGWCSPRVGEPPQLEWKSGVVEIVAARGGVFENMCARLVDGSTRCSGKLADFDLVPHIQELWGLKGLAIGDGHACALDESSHVVCVGDDSSGELGTGRLLSSSVPILVP